MSSRSPASRFSWFPVDGLLKFFHAGSSAAPQPQEPSLGLVLSYGGARGLAHVGVIQVLEEENIPISVIAGSSMGAYIGALWASGASGGDLAKLAAEIKDRRALFSLLDPIFPPMAGFVYGHKIRRHLARTLGETKLEDLKRRILIVATNLDSASAEILHDMPAAVAVHASCAIPGILAPVEWEGHRYIDGGAAAPCPVRLLKQVTNVDHVIAVTVMPTAEDFQICNLDTFPVPPKPARTIWHKLARTLNKRINLFAYGNVLDTFKRCLTAAQRRMVEDDAKAADVLIHPFVCESKWYDFENFDRYINAGRDAATAALPQIRNLLQPKPQPSLNNPHETVPILPAVGHGST